MSLPLGPRTSPEASSRKAAALATMAGAGLLGAARVATGFVGGAGSPGLTTPRAAAPAIGEVAVTGLRGTTLPQGGSASHGVEGLRGFTTAVGLAVCAAGAVARRGQRKAAAGGAANGLSSPEPVALAGDKLPVFAGLAAGRGASTEVQQGLCAFKPVGKHFPEKPTRKFKSRAMERRREMWLKYSVNYRGRKRNCHRIAKEAVMKALKQKGRCKAILKKQQRRLWIMRLNAACRLHGLTYSRFIARCKMANVNLNRKILSQLAIFDRPVFTSVMDVVVDNWPERLQHYNREPKQFSVEEIDNIALPWLERQLPQIYTDNNVRFNRKVADHGAVEYTVDFGDTEQWREYLPQTPELANFNIPDHWIKDANRGFEPWKIDYFEFPGEKNDNRDYINVMKSAKASQLEEEGKKEKGEPNRLSKESSREDWFTEEPQSWFDN